MRNRDRLIDAARNLFSTSGSTVALDAIAKQAGVGIGTLYRHFPTREALITAVYGAELIALEDQVDALLTRQSAADALRRWMDGYARLVSTKQAMYGALQFAFAPAGTGGSATRARVSASIAKFVAAAAADDSLRTDVSPDDIALLLAAIVLMTIDASDPERTQRLLDVLMDGLRS